MIQCPRSDKLAGESAPVEDTPHSVTEQLRGGWFVQPMHKQKHRNLHSKQQCRDMCTFSVQWNLYIKDTLGPCL